MLKFLFVFYLESFSLLLCKIQTTFRFFTAAAPETEFHQSIHLAAFIWKSVSGHHRVIAMETERERESITQWQVSGGSGTDRHAPLGPCRPNQQGCAQTGADLSLLQCHWSRQDCYRLGRVRDWSRQCCHSYISLGESAHKLAEEAA